MAVTLNPDTETYQEDGYVRYSTSQEDHVEPGLRFFWIHNDKERTEDTTKRDRGTILHGYFATILSGHEPKIPENQEWAKAPVEQFKKWVEAH